MRWSRLLPIGLALALAGCAETQMRYNALTYDDAVADSANELLLLNAVRASQRYPMSFIQVGGILSTPQVAGNLGGTMNFANHIGFTTASLTPNASTLSPGYSQLNLSNLNDGAFMVAMRKPVSPAIIDSFFASNWPRELLELIFILKLEPSEAAVAAIDSGRKAVCSGRATERHRRLCDVLEEDIALYDLHCSAHFSNSHERMRQFRGDNLNYYNSAATQCHFLRFQIMLREMRLLRADPCPADPKKHRPAGCIKTRYRSALQMIQYLGELIAAQHYVEAPFIPEALIGHSTLNGGQEYVRAPLFVVKRDLTGVVRAAVTVRHEREIFYIPVPDFGSPTEARSLQVLDLVLQGVRAATTKDDIPKVPPTINVAKQ